ncbi:MAG: DUF262 domain-containing protein [Actinomycetota bacterium]
MKPETRTIAELFELDVRYEVPLYQRPYVWDEEKQWQPLWDDISALLGHHLSPGTDGQWSHFMGAIVLEQETQPPGSVPVYTVIDGQQRLTTTQILLSAASHVTAARGSDKDAALLRDLITNNPLKVAGHEVFKVWPTNANRAAFSRVMGEHAPDPLEDDDDNLIDEAYHFFCARFSEFLDEESASYDIEALCGTLRVALCALLKVVAITLETGDNAQIIFETLNARGTPLLALDLVKNSVFHLATRQEHDVDALHDGTWKPELELPYWRKERRQGRLTRPLADLFLMHWLTMKTMRVIPATELFSTFRQDILKQDVDAEVVVRELCRDAATMRGFDDLADSTPEGMFFSRLEALDVSTLFPIALYLFREPAITAEVRRSALGVLESWVVRRTLVRLTGKNYNVQIPALIAKVSESPAEADSILSAELAVSTSEITRWPDDEEVMAFLTTHDAYGHVSRRVLVVALSAIEQSLYRYEADVLGLPAGLTIEHVMPQKWKKNWRSPAELDKAGRIAFTEERELRINRLGNLTLTVGKLNTSLSNKAWPQKQKELHKNSRLLLTAHLIEDHPEEFTEADIDKRTVALAERICEIWPSGS